MSFDATQLLATAATVYGIGGALSMLLQARQMRTRGSSERGVRTLPGLLT